MKPLFFILIAAFMISCGNNEPQKASTDLINIPASADSSRVSSKGTPVLSFEKTEHDFGRITYGEVAEYNFRFTNTGDADLLIASANASCGCTVPQYSKEPVAPGQTGFIKVKFNSEGRMDAFHKEVTITANTNPTETFLKITGVIVSKTGTSGNNNLVP